MLTHANLLANVRQMIPRAGFTENDVFVSWLPVYHDMGLITMTMCPFYLGAALVLLPVSLKPGSWFDAIKRYKGTMTAAPDFAYRFAAQFSKKGSAYDLSSLRVALIAAEPVRTKTVRDFERKFNLKGVLKPGYGLAESSVAVTFWDLDREEIKVDENNYVSAGTPLPGLDIAIASDSRFLGLNEVGEIVFRSPSATSGYYRNREATEALHFKDGFIRTGDVGYLDRDHNLFIVDRSKNIIIRAGRNISPREIEELTDAIEGVRSSAVFGVDENRMEGEQIHLVVEVNEHQRGVDDMIQSLPVEIMERVGRVLEYKPDEIHIVKRKTIPRTYNGKTRYHELKSSYLNRRLESRRLN
jgi:acyl-CoA synthetase (AMP-forming)/AMP-acid ligase II